MPHFVEIAFPLYEFDDPAEGGRRWFAHWDGPIGSPAEEVLLGWARDDTTVIVCTSSHAYDASLARWRAAHLALGGTLLHTAGSQRTEMTAAEIGREINRIRDTDALWSPFDGTLAGTFDAEIAVCDGFTLAYGIREHGAVLLAVAGPAPEDLRVRLVEDWTPYGDLNRTFR